jgi:uncharacterized SAM-binding protein YcdF (DUF218 family)
MSTLTFFAYKLAQEAIYPMNWALLCLMLAYLCVRRQRPVAGRRFLVIGLLLFVVPSTGFMAEALMAPLESIHPAKRIHEYPDADLIVVLGGTTGAVREPRLEAEEIHGARLQTAVRLYRAGKGKAVVVSGGLYRLPGDKFRSEAEDMRDVLEGLGVPRSAVVMEPRSRNTYENAKFTAELLRERGASRVLLVTSALHMPRAAALFRRHGVDATPVPCSFLSGARHGPISGLKPEAIHLQHSESAVKEYVGRFVYWLFGRA